ncbi:acyltransferase family protein, partial [Neobacillus niacini]|uniref:acyltransferase family protein n=1 Tax=Neobacillus niacini TaxID=86668 RepID=UPI003000E730
RYEELDSIRGLAAISVVLFHLGLVFYSRDFVNFPPVHILFSGKEAVMLFFVLSGYVLSLPFYVKREFFYLNYIIKRICRIYIPYLVALSVSLFSINLYSNGGIETLSEWFNRYWINEVELINLLQHIIFIGSYDNNTINPVFWSLVHEMRISLIFPLIMPIII